MNFLNSVRSLNLWKILTQSITGCTAYRLNIGVYYHSQNGNAMPPPPLPHLSLSLRHIVDIEAKVYECVQL